MPSDPQDNLNRLRTDLGGEIDLEQLEYNLSLTPAQRIAQYMQWLEFLQIVRAAGERHYGLEFGPAQTPE